MNIFALSECPEQSALWLDDIRKNKMILESAQMLSTAIRWLDPDTTLPVYKLAYINHPCSKWARQSRSNFKWLLDHMTALFNQKVGSHASSRLLPAFQEYVDNGKEAVGCGDKLSAILVFLSFLIIVVLIFLNLFIAIILQAY